MNARALIVGALILLGCGCNLFESVEGDAAIGDDDMPVNGADAGYDQDTIGDGGSDLAESDAELDAGEDAGGDMAVEGVSWTMVSAGEEHTCALTEMGEAYCWGRGGSGRTGLGDERNVATPEPVNTDVRFEFIDAGGEHTCALTEDGELYCWGRSAFIGVPIGEVVPTPARVDGNTFIDVSTGEDHTCAVTRENEVWCAGDNGTGELGQMGVDSAAIFARVEGVSARSVAVGDDVSCVLGTDDLAYCWGRSFSQRDGDEMPAFSATPTVVDEDLRFDKLALGEQSACGLSLDEPGTIYCWGSGYYLRAARPNFEVPAPINSAFAFVDISLGVDFGCAIAENELTFCWGSNYRARMGSGGHTSDPEDVTPLSPMNTNEVFTSISAGGTHGCGINSAGELLCWGRELWGATGTGELGYRTEPVEVQRPANQSFSWISAGEYHTCGVADGSVYCWGRGSYGAIGVPDRDEYPTPLDIGYFSDAVMVESIRARNCVIDLAGKASCWGDDEYGTLGNGYDIGDVETPGPVLGGLAFDTISMNLYSTCGLTTDRKIACWGREDYIGGPDQQSLPTVPSGHSDYVDISTGRAHSCGVDTNGQAHCWGQNGYGQLGTGDRTDSLYTPVAVDSTESFVQIEAAYYNTCAISTNDGLFCWGDDRIDGQPSGGDSLSPERVTSNLNFQRVDGNRFHFCAISDGAVYCWGNNEYGEVGISALGRINAPIEVSLPDAAREVSAGQDHACAILEDGRVFCWGLGEFGRLGHDVLGYLDEPARVDVSNVSR